MIEEMVNESEEFLTCLLELLLVRGGVHIPCLLIGLSESFEVSLDFAVNWNELHHVIKVEGLPWVVSVIHDGVLFGVCPKFSWVGVVIGLGLVVLWRSFGGTLPDVGVLHIGLLALTGRYVCCLMVYLIM